MLLCTLSRYHWDNIFICVQVYPVMADVNNTNLLFDFVLCKGRGCIRIVGNGLLTKNKQIKISSVNCSLWEHMEWLAGSYSHKLKCNQTSSWNQQLPPAGLKKECRARHLNRGSFFRTRSSDHTIIIIEVVEEEMKTMNWIKVNINMSHSS